MWFGQTRRSAIIPVLFFVPLIVTLAFTLHSFNANKRLNDMVRVISWQRKIKEHYILNLFNAGNGIPADTQTGIRELIRNLRIMEKGGSIVLPDSTVPVVLPAAETVFIRNEIRRKINLYTALRNEGQRLKRAKAGAEAYRTHLLAFNVILHQIELPSKDILNIYTAAINRELNSILLLELIAVVLASGLGVLLSILQKGSNKALAESEARFRQIFNVGPLAKLMITLDGQVLRVNSAVPALLGYSEDELLQHTLQSLSHPDDLKVEEPLRAALINGERASYQIPKRYRHHDGYFIRSLSTMAIINDNTGKAAFAIVQIHDITEQLKTLDALEASEERYKRVIESATDGIIVANMDNVILSANSNAHHIFEYEPDELIGRELSTIIPPVYREAHLSAVQRVKETRHSRLAGRQLEMEGLKKNGFIFPLELSMSIWETPDGEIMATAILRDISERKIMQRERELLLQSNKNLEEFTLIASHDLQEPLRKICFYTERLSTRENKHLKEESLIDIQRLISSVHRMQSLITDLLAYSRIAPQNTRYEPVDLNQILHELEDELWGELRRNDARLEIEELPTIEADEKQIRNLFKNLIQNALKYRQTEVSPHIRIYGKLLHGITNQSLGSANVPLLEIRVQDNGLGFNEKYLDRIFKVFQKLHSQTEFPGTGIGLATCKKIVEQHSGQITATSELKRGSTFIITLPVKQN